MERKSKFGQPFQDIWKRYMKINYDNLGNFEKNRLMHIDDDE